MKTILKITSNIIYYTGVTLWWVFVAVAVASCIYVSIPIILSSGVWHTICTGLMVIATILVMVAAIWTFLWAESYRKDKP